MSQKAIAVFDADSHILEPSVIWSDYVDREYRIIARSAFYFERDEVGTHTILNGRPAPSMHGGNIPRHAVWRPGMGLEDIGSLDSAQTYAANPGASDQKVRVTDMDTMGIDQALVFPTMFNEYLPLVESPDIAHALARAYNDWVWDFCKAVPNRLFPVAVLPTQNVSLAVKEARRVGRLGFRAVLIRPVFSGGRFPTDRYYRPLWEALQECNLLGCIHPSAGPATPELDSNSGFVERVSANLGLGHTVAEVIAPTMDNATLLLSIMFDGLLERFPSLKLAFVHSGTSWLPVALEKAEAYLWLTRQTDPVSLDPEAVFNNRDALVAFGSGDGSVRRMPELFGGIAAWGSRYPNQDTTTAWEGIDDLQRADVGDSVVTQLMGGNMYRILGIEPKVYVR